MKIVGRRAETTLLQGLLHKDNAEFVAVYGRRRVGKTYLIREVYKEQIVFECSGLHQKSFKQQLENFWLTLLEYKESEERLSMPSSWLRAFAQLKSHIKKINHNQKKVIFLDEVSWFETPRAGFLAALDNFWNQFCSKRDDIILVICGSAASWIINKVINDRGGLHNRITVHVQLMPFTLYETRAYLEMKGIQLSIKDIIQLYMSIGGIPFYLKDVHAGKSIPQILDDLFFKKQATLRNEFSNLYASLFKNSELHELIVATLASKNIGLTRKEIIQLSGIKSGSALSVALQELIECGFIKSIRPIEKLKNGRLYRLIDEYSIFYFNFLEGRISSNSWQHLSNQQSYKIWLGFAFETLCLKHTFQIKKALGIQGIISDDYSWSKKNDREGKGTQIDLLIDRTDNCINLLEVKFHTTQFEITKQYAQQLQQKIDVFKQHTKTNKNIFLTMLTVFGVRKNKHYLSVVSNQILAEALFQE